MGRRALVVANWKMNGRKAQVAALTQSFVTRLDGLATEIVVCPPYPYLAQVEQALKGAGIGLGAQDVHEATQGAYTGDVSAGMLRDFSCTYVLVGHSERRQHCGDTEVRIAAKFAAAVREDLVPILCVGENAAERSCGNTARVVSAQVDSVVDQVGIAAFARAVVAYEPVWAIGSGNAASPADAQTVHSVIRERIARRDEALAANMRVLYGGSVNAANAAAFCAQADVDGVLVGGASLVEAEFLAICSGIEALGAAVRPMSSLV